MCFSTLRGYTDEDGNINIISPNVDNGGSDSGGSEADTEEEETSGEEEEEEENPEDLKKRLAEESAQEILNMEVPELEGVWRPLPPPLEAKKSEEGGSEQRKIVKPCLIASCVLLLSHPYY